MGERKWEPQSADFSHQKFRYQSPSFGIYSSSPPSNAHSPGTTAPCGTYMRVAGGVLKTRMLGPHLKLAWDLLETGCSSPWIPVHSQAQRILGGGKPRVRRQNAWVSHLPDSRLSWSCYEAERGWLSGSPFTTRGKSHIPKEKQAGYTL